MYRVDVLTRFKVTQVPLMYLFCVMHHNWPTRESDLMFITDTNTFFALNSSNAWSSRLFGDHILLSLSLTIPGYSRASSSTCIWKSKEERYSARKWSILFLSYSVILIVGNSGNLRIHGNQIQLIVSIEKVLEKCYPQKKQIELLNWSEKLVTFFSETLSHLFWKWCKSNFRKNR